MLGWLARSREAQLQIGAVALIVAAIIVNLLQLDVEPGRHMYQPLSRYDTADITKIAERKPKLKKRYGLFFELGRRFPGATLIVPHSLPLESAFVAGALSYGRAARVAAAPLEVDTVLPGLDYRPSVVAQGEDEKGGEWLVVASDANASVFIVLQQEDKTVLLDLSLLVKSRDKPRD
jgi:hypothetical protein